MTNSIQNSRSVFDLRLPNPIFRLYKRLPFIVVSTNNRGLSCRSVRWQSSNESSVNKRQNHVDIKSKSLHDQQLSWIWISSSSSRERQKENTITIVLKHRQSLSSHVTNDSLFRDILSIIIINYVSSNIRRHWHSMAERSINLKQLRSPDVPHYEPENFCEANEQLRHEKMAILCDSLTKGRRDWLLFCLISEWKYERSRKLLRCIHCFQSIMTTTTKRRESEQEANELVRKKITGQNISNNKLLDNGGSQRRWIIHYSFIFLASLCALRRKESTIAWSFH